MPITLRESLCVVTPPYTLCKFTELVDLSKQSQQDTSPNWSI